MSAAQPPPAAAAESLHGVLFSDGCSLGEATVPYAVKLVQGPVTIPSRPPLWRREDRGAHYLSINAIYASDEGCVLRIDCQGRGAFAIEDHQITVDWQGGTSFHHYLQTLGLSLWLERQGVPCLHANTLAIDECTAIGLLAPSQGGKSTLSAALAARGMALMSDDMAALYPSRQPGAGVYPARAQLRLWPDALAQLPDAREARDCPRVHERFDKRLMTLPRSVQGQRRLTHLFILDRCDDATTDISLDAVPPADALIHCLRQSMLADAYEPMGLAHRRVAVLARALAGMKVWRLRYGSSHERIGDVAHALAQHVQRA